jgi:hypothetical protein
MSARKFRSFGLRMKNGLWGIHKALQRLLCSEYQTGSLDRSLSEVLSRGAIGSCQAEVWEDGAH